MKKKKKLNIIDFKKRHALNRFYDRFGTILSKEDYEIILSKIKNSKADLLQRHKNNNTLYHMWHMNIEFICVYNSELDVIVTFYEPTQDKFNKGLY